MRCYVTLSSSTNRHCSPGQPLPNFAKPTHGKEPGLLPFTTVNEVLAQVPADIKPHMAETVIRREGYEMMMPSNGDRPLRGAITCNGGAKNLHPSGERSFNLQELSQLQGFPPDHGFVGSKTSILRQIGNAVPAGPASPYFKNIKNTVDESKEEVMRYQQQVIQID